MCIRDSAQPVVGKVEGEELLERFVRTECDLLYFWLGVQLGLDFLDPRNKFMVPETEVDVPVKISARHLLLTRPGALS
jgi:hypothetical protein